MTLLRRWPKSAWMALVLVSSLAAGCGDDSPTAPSHFAAFSKTDVIAGTGTEAVAGSLLTVKYTGWLFNGEKTDRKGAQFDSSVGREPLEFTLGAGQVIAGWDDGVLGMKEGGMRRLIIPPSLAYGGVRNGPIPPNATLVFEIELVDVAGDEDDEG